MAAANKIVYPLCVQCSKKVYPAEGIKMEDFIYHSACLKCIECKKLITGANFGGFVPNGEEGKLQPYCKVHHQRLIQSKGNSVEFARNQGVKPISKT